MKKVLFAATALLLATGAVAQAQPQPQPGWNGGQRWDGNAFWRGGPEGPRERIQFLQDRVNHGVADGSLDRREAGRVNGELNGLRQWIQRKHWQDQGRLTPDQNAQVQGRLDQISRQIRWMAHRGR